MTLARDRGVMLEAKDFTASAPKPVESADGRLGILIVGLGAVSTTFIAGVENARRNSGNRRG